MSPELISELLDSLQSFEASDIVENPYAVAGCTANLDAYLHALCTLPFSGHLLVGEAPGYRGCALTGIPFTSQRVLAADDHPFLVSLRSSVSLSGSVTESTATIVWQSLAQTPAVPAFWNAFPFHPHKLDNPASNRAPTPAEIRLGRTYLEFIVKILQPRSIIAIGKAAASALVPIYGTNAVIEIRHPSNGGKPAFLSGLRKVGVISN